MGVPGVFDPTFDFRTDAGGGDPDATSPTLRRYHQLLWSKPLPSGAVFRLEDDDTYLRYASPSGEFLLSSDAATPTWSKWKRTAHITSQLPAEDLAAFRTVVYQMGAMLLFPRNRVDGNPTINTAKGFNSRIVDRIDLTLECIRLHYTGLHDPAVNPLGPVLTRYADFFALFEGFPGYVDFFLLQDLVDSDSTQVRFLHPGGFDTPLPRSTAAYLAYRDATVSFVRARNTRMLRWVQGVGLG